jgi:hypothetical protein
MLLAGCLLQLTSHTSQRYCADYDSLPPTSIIESERESYSESRYTVRTPLSRKVQTPYPQAPRRIMTVGTV